MCISLKLKNSIFIKVKCTTTLRYQINVHVWFTDKNYRANFESIRGHRRPLEATRGQLRILEIKYRTCTFIRYLRVLLQGFSSITNEAKLCFFHRSYYANIKLFFFEYASALSSELELHLTFLMILQSNCSRIQIRTLMNNVDVGEGLSTFLNPTWLHQFHFIKLLKVEKWLDGVYEHQFQILHRNEKCILKSWCVFITVTKSGLFCIEMKHFWQHWEECFQALWNQHQAPLIEHMLFMHSWIDLAAHLKSLYLYFYKALLK